MRSTTARIKDTSERAVVGLRSLHTPVCCLPSGIGGQEKERAFWLRSGLGLEVGYLGSSIACGLVTAAPWGFCTVAAGWFSSGSPLLFSGWFVVVTAVVLLGFLCPGGPLVVCGSDLFRVCLWSRGQVCRSSHSLLHICMEKPYLQGRSHLYPQVFGFRC
ncbi:hypothetical protein ILYODFUR_014022 [Ilyodon furcidens]|uniref:Uncharacterized protein n=1 Tax=Ilyodon furcidens TaxID=33524 RepID=A0ABV0UI29_9TELE